MDQWLRYSSLHFLIKCNVVLSLFFFFLICNKFTITTWRTTFFFSIHTPYSRLFSVIPFHSWIRHKQSRRPLRCHFLANCRDLGSGLGRHVNSTNVPHADHHLETINRLWWILHKPCLKMSSRGALVDVTPYYILFQNCYATEALNAIIRESWQGTYFASAGKYH